MGTDAGFVVDLGIGDADRAAIAQGLERLLADSYTLYLKTQNFHWNVTGPMFSTLHLLFEGQYTELAVAVDLIAERIRSLGAFAPGSFVAFARLSSGRGGHLGSPAKEMIRQLLVGHRAGRPDRARRVLHRRCRKRPVDRGSADTAPAGPSRRRRGCCGA